MSKLPYKASRMRGRPRVYTFIEFYTFITSQDFFGGAMSSSSFSCRKPWKEIMRLSDYRVFHFLWVRPGLGWLWFKFLPCLPSSAWTNGNLAEAAGQYGRMPKLKSTQSHSRWITLYINVGIYHQLQLSIFTNYRHISPAFKRKQIESMWRTKLNCTNCFALLCPNKSAMAL